MSLQPSYPYVCSNKPYYFSALIEVLIDTAFSALVEVSNLQVSSSNSEVGATLSFTWDVTDIWKNDIAYVESYRITITDAATGVSTSHISKAVNEADFQVRRLSSNARIGLGK